ncbi:MAG: OmpA family protein, partial [Ectothiorhodospiraceae bacterium]
RHAEIAQALAENGAAESEAKRINTQRDSLRLKAREQELSSQQKEIEQLRQQLAELKPRVSDEGITLTIGNVLFDFDSAVLSAAASEPLDRLAAFLRQHPDRNVRVEGYTDSVGDAAYNQQLSQRRALSVADAMAQRGISHDRMSVTGYGEKNPVASNDTEAGRRQNRRVEFVILN